MQEFQLTPQLILTLIMIPVIFVGFVVVGIYALIKNSKRSGEAVAIYHQIAAELNWRYSPNGQGLEDLRSYFEFINKTIFADRIRHGIYPPNILSGNTSEAIFASFDLIYRNNIHSNNNLPPRNEKGIFMVSNSLSLPQFLLTKRSGLANSFQAISGKSQDRFAAKYQINSYGQPKTEDIFSNEVFQLIETAQIIRVIGYRNFLCIFFQRNVADLPDLKKIDQQKNIVFQLNKLLRNEN